MRRKREEGAAKIERRANLGQGGTISFVLEPQQEAAGDTESYRELQNTGADQYKGGPLIEKTGKT